MNYRHHPLINLYPYLKYGINVINDNGVLKIVDERHDQLQLPPIEIDQELFHIIARFDGKRTVKQISENLRETMESDPMPIMEELFDILNDRIEFHRADSMVRVIKCRDS